MAPVAPCLRFLRPRYWILPVLAIGPSTASTIMRDDTLQYAGGSAPGLYTNCTGERADGESGDCKACSQNALIPIITVAGLSFGGLLGGAVMAETIFSIPALENDGRHN